MLENYRMIKKMGETANGENTLYEDKNTKEECVLREITTNDE